MRNCAKQFRKSTWLWILLHCAIFSVGTQGQAQVTRQPYLQIATSTSITIRWQTGTGEAGKLYYGISPDKLADWVIESDEERIYHEVKITGLKPYTKYYYSVDGQVGNELRYFITSPEPGDEKPVRIWVISDFGQTNSEDNVRRSQTVERYYLFNNNNYHADLVLSLGDQSEDDAVYQIQHNYFSQLGNVLLTSPLYTIIGNHDDHDSVRNYMRTFTLPSSGEAGGVPSHSKKYYSFDHSNIHFVMLCTEVNDDEMKAETEWLKKDLEKNDKEWLIAVMHQPLHSAGYHPTDGNEWSRQRRIEWLTALEEHGVDLILQGHNHVYERSFLVDNIIGTSADVKDANILNRGLGRDDADGAYKKPAGNKPHKGTVFITCTGGGVANSIRHYPAPYSFIPVKFPGSDYEGSVVIDVNKNQMDVKFICDEPDGKGSHIWDYFTIRKEN